jgi:hypothetical protein
MAEVSDADGAGVPGAALGLLGFVVLGFALGGGFV